jgi:hypothetical protein
MLKAIIEFFKAIFDNPVIQNDLEAYIIAGKPENAADVDRLEREFNTQRKHLSRYWAE